MCCGDGGGGQRLRGGHVGRLLHLEQALQDELEGGPRVGRGCPALLHELRVVRRAVVWNGRPQVLLRRRVRNLHALLPAVRLLPRQQLPQHDAKGVHVHLVGVPLHADDLGRRPRRRAASRQLGGVVAVQHARQAKVGHLGVQRLIHQDVARLEVALHNAAAAVQVVDAARDVQREAVHQRHGDTHAV